jgi:hypothetical protein
VARNVFFEGRAKRDAGAGLLLFESEGNHGEFASRETQTEGTMQPMMTAVEAHLSGCVASSDETVCIASELTFWRGWGRRARNTIKKF